MSLVTPRPTSTSQPYWDGCGEGELRLQFCEQCRQFQFYPRVMCCHCGHCELVWRRASGDGVIASFTVVRRAVSPAYQAPYVVALIDLAEGPRMMSAIVDAEPEQLAVGVTVAVDFQAWSDDISLPVFRLRQKGGAS